VAKRLDARYVPGRRSGAWLKDGRQRDRTYAYRAEQSMQPRERQMRFRLHSSCTEHRHPQCARSAQQRTTAATSRCPAHRAARAPDRGLQPRPGLPSGGSAPGRDRARRNLVTSGAEDDRTILPRGGIGPVAGLDAARGFVHLGVGDGRRAAAGQHVVHAGCQLLEHERPRSA